VLSSVEEITGLIETLLSPHSPHLTSFTFSIACQRESWLCFHHASFNQQQDRPEDQSSLRKMLEISDLFRFISEFVFESEGEGEEDASEESDLSDP
jgi:hypothetical protein